MKAGLLPRLSNHVITVYLEATAEETEIRLLNGLRNRCPALSDNLSLKETLAALRHGRGIPVGKKVLIVLDQFEQWLHAKKEDEHSELVESLRQCDGRRVQCIVMVRDDFWMAATRFMRELEIRLLEAQNSAAVDLFPIRHAEKVLAAFGQAFGAFPDGSARENKEAKEFLKHAVSGLAQEGKGICVRLALFSEMMKGKAWTKVGLKEVGGTEGIGVTFLEETFSATTALPERRRHQHAVRSVLKELLPELGTDIKGHSHSYAELLEESGYTNRPEDFNNLLRILDSELRLITPTDPEGVEGEGWRVAGKDEDSRSSSLPLIPPPSSRHAPPSTRHAPPSTSSSTHHPSGAVHVSSELSAVGSVAVRHGAGGEMLSGDEIVSQRGVVRPDEPHPSGGGVGPGEHRRGTGEGAHQGVPEPFEHRPGIADGSGNTFDAQSTSGIARTVGTGKPAGPDGSNQPHAQRPEELTPLSDAPRPDNRIPAFKIVSSAIDSAGHLAAEYTCDGDSASPEVQWKGFPAETKYFAVSLWHTAPDQEKSYWVLYNIPADVTTIPKNSKTTGTQGLNDKKRTGYDPMCSKGPGVKKYHLTVYALSAKAALVASQATRANLLKAIKDITLAEATLDFQ